MGNGVPYRLQSRKRRCGREAGHRQPTCIHARRKPLVTGCGRPDSPTRRKRAAKRNDHKAHGEGHPPSHDVVCDRLSE
jgi:hypothetical protein